VPSFSSAFELCCGLWLLAFLGGSEKEKQHVLLVCFVQLAAHAHLHISDQAEARRKRVKDARTRKAAPKAAKPVAAESKDSGKK
jgi:hypothetical protein